MAITSEEAIWLSLSSNNLGEVFSGGSLELGGYFKVSEAKQNKITAKQREPGVFEFFSTETVVTDSRRIKV